MRTHGTPEQLETRRRQAMVLLRKGHTYREVAQRVKASLSSVVRWCQAYRKRGRRGLRSQATWGRPGWLSSEQKEALRQRLLKGALAAGHSTDLWTLRRIGHLIERHYKVRYTSVGVWKLLRQELGWSCQKPERRALERNDEAVARWKKVTWPRIKKSPRTWGPSGVSRRKRLPADSQCP